LNGHPEVKLFLNFVSFNDVKYLEKSAE
jgi:hypothetical protein